MNWYDYWHSQSQVADVAKLETADLLKQCDFFPAVKEAIFDCANFTGYNM